MNVSGVGAGGVGVVGHALEVSRGEGLQPKANRVSETDANSAPDMTAPGHGNSLRWWRGYHCADLALRVLASLMDCFTQWVRQGPGLAATNTSNQCPYVTLKCQTTINWDLMKYELLW